MDLSEHGSELNTEWAQLSLVYQGTVLRPTELKKSIGNILRHQEKTTLDLQTFYICCICVSLKPHHMVCLVTNWTHGYQEGPSMHISFTPPISYVW